jgi:hypothetical protein
MGPEQVLDGRAGVAGGLRGIVLGRGHIGRAKCSRHGIHKRALTSYDCIAGNCNAHQPGGGILGS